MVQLYLLLDRHDYAEKTVKVSSALHAIWNYLVLLYFPSYIDQCEQSRCWVLLFSGLAAVLGCCMHRLMRGGAYSLFQLRSGRGVDVLALILLAMLQC